MIRLLQCLFLSLLLPLAHTFGILDVIVQRAAGRSHERIGSGLTKVEEGSEAVVLSRRRQLVGAAVLLPFIAAGTPPARADVSDGNVLPKGAQQFARVVKLKTDLKDVAKRLTTAADGEIDKKEWDNISKFLRTIYSTAENDMKAIAKGVFNPANQKQALNDAEEVKKYAQAGDVSASKQDTARLASILAKISELVDDFFDALSDVPDEI